MVDSAKRREIFPREESGRESRERGREADGGRDAVEKGRKRIAREEKRKKEENQNERTKTKHKQLKKQGRKEKERNKNRQERSPRNARRAKTLCCSRSKWFHVYTSVQSKGIAGRENRSYSATSQGCPFAIIIRDR